MPGGKAGAGARDEEEVRAGTAGVYNLPASNFAHTSSCWRICKGALGTDARGAKGSTSSTAAGAAAGGGTEGEEGSGGAADGMGASGTGTDTKTGAGGEILAAAAAAGSVMSASDAKILPSTACNLLGGDAPAEVSSCMVGEPTPGGEAAPSTEPSSTGDGCGTPAAGAGTLAAAAGAGSNDTFGRTCAGGGVFTCNGIQSEFMGGPTFGDTEPAGNGIPAGRAARSAGGATRAPLVGSVEAGRDGGREHGRDLLAGTRWPGVAHAGAVWPPASIGPATDANAGSCRGT